ncbi:hypothetical protein KBD49_02230 [Myxococcota bacterium]|nr:hypothetical protein [Myxococcota bacterium]
MNRTLPSDEELLGLVWPALRPLNAEGSGGSHTEVMVFEAGALEEILCREAGGSPKAADRTRSLARSLADRFLVKVGNIDRYVVKLREDRESVIPRHLVSEAFGPAGYNLAPTLDKVMTDAREAVREIPYFGFGRLEDQFAPDPLEQIRGALGGSLEPVGDPDGTFLVVEDGRRVRHSAFDILHEDPFFREAANSPDSLFAFQQNLRRFPLDLAATERLRPFFDAPITVGVRDVLRYLHGSRHPALDWNRAHEVIRRSFATHGRQNFLPPEINYYVREAAVDRERARWMARENRETASAFARWMVERLPWDVTAPLSDARLEEIAWAVLELHHDYPLYEVEPYSGVLSLTTLRLALRAAVSATEWLLDIPVPVRRNALHEEMARRAAPLARWMDDLPPDRRLPICNLLNGMLWEMAMRGGVPREDGTLARWRIHRKTFYSFQEKAGYGISRSGRLTEVVPLEALRGPEGPRIRKRHPELDPMLVVFFTVAYRYFLDTGHAPDFRPDQAGRDLFLMGEWGDLTRNVLLGLGEAPDGRPLCEVRFVDNKDQFKQYRSWEDRAHPMGLVKYGLRLVEPLVRPGLERALGRAVERAEEGLGGRPGRAPARSQRLVRVTGQVLRQGVDFGTSHLQAFLHDLIDDTVAGVLWALGRRGDPEPREGADGAPGPEAAGNDTDLSLPPSPGRMAGRQEVAR